MKAEGDPDGYVWYAASLAHVATKAKGDAIVAVGEGEHPSVSISLSGNPDQVEAPRARRASEFGR